MRRLISCLTILFWLWAIWFVILILIIACND